jgi:hypothetical protein
MFIHVYNLRRSTMEVKEGLLICGRRKNGGGGNKKEQQSE